MKVLKNILVYGLSAAAVIVSLAALTRLVEPKYDGGEYPLEGNFTSEYYEETLDHDVLMIGDCEVYENFDPIYLWQNYGITSYIRGNAQQLTWQSYYMLEDALKYEKPKVVIYNVQALTHKKPQREEYNRMTLDGMKWSKTKWDAIQASMCPGEKTIEYIFPLLRYHSRITSLGEEDLTYYMEPRHVTCNGYYMRIDVLPASQAGMETTDWIKASYPGEIEETVEETPEDGTEADAEAWNDEIEDPWADVDIGEEAEDLDRVQTYTTEDKGKPFGNLPMEYLDRIRKLCEENEIRLILIKAPSLSPQWYDSQEKQVVDYAEKYNLPYINFYKLISETGIDYETDTYDGGLHMNYSGAKKLSEWLGNELKTKYEIRDHRVDKKYAEVYREKVNWQQELIKAQEAELELYGEVRNY
ncbi:MAG: SGNH/GDSL hydrolase family protein [Eubacterium sp.]|nr:SGNH/GDSL hydrolase family protein [Eubacterium sp.]